MEQNLLALFMSDNPIILTVVCSWLFIAIVALAFCYCLFKVNEPIKLTDLKTIL